MTTPRPAKIPAVAPRHTAVLRVTPTGTSQRVPRDYMISLELSIGETETELDLAKARAFASSALSGVSSHTTATDSTPVRDLRSGGRPLKGGLTSPSVLSAVEAEVLCAGWPAAGTLACIRTELSQHGYLVTTVERRACAEPGCTTEVDVQQTHRDDAPQSWYSAHICGRHNYRACATCRSVFKFVSVNTSGPAPSVHCSVCQTIMIEWGGTKLWEVELVSRAPTPLAVTPMPQAAKLA